LLGGNLPELIGRLPGFTLNDPQPYRYTLMIVAVVIAIAFFVALTIEAVEDEPDIAEVNPKDENPPQKIKPTRFTVGVIALIGLMSFVRFLQLAGIGTATIYFNVYMDTELSLSPGAIGFIAAIGRLIAVPTSLLVPRLVRYRGTGLVAAGASLATVIFFLPLALIPFWIAAAIGYIGVLATSSLRFAAFIIYIMELVPKNQQPVMAGAGEMAAGFSFALMALGGGYILALFSFRDLFLLGGGLSALGTFIFWLYLRHGQTASKQVLQSGMRTQGGQS
jgi:hypothetical protein